MKTHNLQINHMGDIEDIEKVSLENRLDERTTYDILKTAVKQWPARKALIFLSSTNPLDKPATLTYQQLFNAVNQTANLLVGLGIKADDAVSYILPNIPENYFLSFAAQAVGIANPISFQLPAEQIADLLRTARSEILIITGPKTDPILWKKFLAVRALYSHIKKIIILENSANPQQNIYNFYELLETQPLSPLFDEKSIKPETICSYFHTSGTVGPPKLVQHTHWGFVYTAWAAGIFADYTRENTVVLSGFPMFHVSAPILQGLSAILYGASVVVMSPLGWQDPTVISHFWKIVEKYGGTSVAAVPTIYKALLQTPLNEANVKSLHSAISGNVAISKEDSDQFHAITGVRISTLWGQTEAIVGCLNPSAVPGSKNFGSAGLRLPYLQMKIVRLNKDGAIVHECSPMEPGLLCIKGPNVASYKIAELNQISFLQSGWFNTGDWVYQNKDGYVWILGRQSDFIPWEDKYISLLKIETILHQNPLIKKTAAISVPNRALGESVHVYVMINQEIEINVEALNQEIQITLREKFGSLPIDIEFRSSLPLNGMGKVIKYQLKEEFLSGSNKKV